MRQLLFLLAFLPWVGYAQNDLVINEVMVANLGEVLDLSYNYGGWVELYNPTDAAISLKGYVVKDHKGNSITLTSTHGKVAAHGFKNLWFDHLSDTYTAQLPFKLDCDGGTIALHKGGVCVSSVDYPQAISRTSWSRMQDGEGNFSYCGWATPEATNNGALFASQSCANPSMSGHGGTFYSTATFAVTTPTDVSLYYTTDGTVPTTSNGNRATSPETFGDSLRYTFHVTATTCYRFRCIADTLLPSQVVTRSYIKTSTNGINILSLVADPDDLYDDMKGIYVKGKNGGWSYWETANYYQDWDRPVNFEIYAADDSLLLNQEADMAMSGASSRNYNTLKSFKLKSDKKFNGLNYYPLIALFPDKTHHKFKDVLVRNGGSREAERQTDVALQRVIRHSGLYIDTQDDKPLKVYFNGTEKGVMFLRERTNRQYGDVNYGMDTDSMDTFEDNDITGMECSYGNWTAFNMLYAAAQQAATSATAWETVNSLLDVEDYINYFAIETYLANEDWPQNNIKIFRDYKDGRFHYIIQDLDACPHDTYDIFTRLEYSTQYYYAKAGYLDAKQVIMFLALMDNETFRKQFVDAFCIIAGSVFAPDYIAAELNALQTELLPYYSNHTTMKSNIQTLITDFNATWQSQRLSYLAKWSRAGVKSKNKITATISTTCSEARLHINNLPIPRNAFSGTLYLPITLHAAAHKGYTFKGWKKDGAIVSTETDLTLSASGEYQAVYEKSSVASLAPVVVNELCANGGIYMNETFKRRDWIELYNRSNDVVDLEGCYLSDDSSDPHKYIISSNNISTLLQPHQYCCIWADKADGISEFHANFKLANDSNQLVLLTAADDTWADTLRYHPQEVRHSVGRYPDGAEAIYRFDYPTFGKTNLYTSSAQRLHFDPLPYIPTGIEESLTPNPSEPHPYPSPEGEGGIYNLAGQRIYKVQKGITIVNGKKIIR